MHKHIHMCAHACTHAHTRSIPMLACILNTSHSYRMYLAHPHLAVHALCTHNKTDSVLSIVPLEVKGVCHNNCYVASVHASCTRKWRHGFGGIQACAQAGQARKWQCCCSSSQGPIVPWATMTCLPRVARRVGLGIGCTGNSSKHRVMARHNRKRDGST